MTITARATERAFPTYSRGTIRDEILTSLRIGMRQLVNPDTLQPQPFTEREIATATSMLSRYWREADAIDLVLMSGQQRALYLANQIRPDRANAAFLAGYHGRLWGLTPLPATGASGSVTALATAGTVFVGSTTVPDPVAAQATDPTGKSYQVLYTTTTPGGGSATLTMMGIDTGAETEIGVGTELTWAQNKPLGAAEKAHVATQFTGGHPAETSAQFGQRIMDTIAHKQAAGNSAQMRAWARDSSVAVEDAFVYSCALHNGTVLVCVTQRRSTVTGPDGRIPSVGILAAVTSYLVAPGSPVVPTPPWVVVVPPTQQPTDMVVTMSLPTAQSSGWKDLYPWPEQDTGTPVIIASVSSQTQFRIQTGVGAPGLPAGVTAPSLMVWNVTTSRWESLDVQSVTVVAGPLYEVILNTAPAITIAVDQWVSPDLYSDTRRDLLAETIEAYLDSLGPGEVVNLLTDTRSHRAFRYPMANETFPQRAGTALLSWLHDALGSALADSSLEAISSSVPPVPATPTNGPALIVAGEIGVYPL